MPKIPIALLALVLALWAFGALSALRLRSIADLRIRAPVIELGEGTRGGWKVVWPEWPEGKGAPSLSASGRTWGSFSTPPPSRVFLRVVPAECARFSDDAPIEADGWFQALRLTDGTMWAQLDPTRPCTIEYEVRNFGSDRPARLALEIGGSRDWLIYKNLIVARDLRNMLAGAAAIPLVIWLMVGNQIRVRSRRRTDAASASDQQR